MAPGLRKFALTAHVISSVGWLGAVAVFLALAIAGLVSEDPEMVRAAYLTMDLSARFVIVPLAVAAFLTGLVQALGTTWGLFRHYWVLIKLVITIVATVILLMQLPSISNLAAEAARTTLSSGDLRESRLSLVVHGAGGLVVLLVPTVLSIYKPRGMTRYGQRRQREERRALADAR